METVTISITLASDHATAYVRRWHWRGRARRQVGQTTVRYLDIPGGSASPGALLGALAVALDDSWEADWSLVPKARTGAPGGGGGALDTR